MLVNSGLLGFDVNKNISGTYDFNVTGGAYGSSAFLIGDIKNGTINNTSPGQFLEFFHSRNVFNNNVPAILDGTGTRLTEGLNYTFNPGGWYRISFTWTATGSGNSGTFSANVAQWNGSTFSGQPWDSITTPSLFTFDKSEAYFGFANVNDASTTFDNISITGSELFLADRIWSGGTSEWSTSTSALNWNNGANYYADGKSVLFDNSNTGSFTVNISKGNVEPAGVTFAGEQTYTLTGTNGITGATGLIKAGTGKLIIQNENTYTGTTNIYGGTLALSGSGTLGNGAALILSGGQLDLGVGTATVGAVNVIAAALSGDTISNGSLTGTSYAASNASGNAVISAALLGSAGFTKTGGGTVTLSGANTYTGKTSINAGVLSVNSIADADGSASALGAPANATDGTIALGDTGTLKYTGAGHSSNRVINLSTAGGGAMTLDASGPSGTFALTGGVTSAGTSGTSTLNLTGSGFGSQSGVIADGTAPNVTAVAKSGTGAWTLSGPNTYTGATTVSGGTLNLGHNLALQQSTLAMSGGTLGFAAAITAPTLGGLSGNGNISLATAAAEPVALTVGNNNANTNYGGTLSGGNGLTKAGTGTLTISASQGYSGPTTINGGVVKLVGTPPVPTAGLLRYYTFDDPGNPTADSSPYGVAGTFNYSAAQTSVYSKVGGGAMDLSADRGAQLYPGAGATLGSSGWTFSAWFLGIRDANDWRTLLRGNDHQLIVESGSTQLGYYNNGNNSCAGGFNASGYSIPSGWTDDLTTWHFISAVYDGTKTSYYVDGATTPVGTVNGTMTSTDLEAIGAYPGGSQGFAKYIDDIYLYNRALTTDELNGVYAAGTGGGGGSNLLPATTALTIAANSTLDLSGGSQQIGSLTGSGTVTNTGGSAATLTVNGGTSSIFGGVIGDGLGKTALTVSGGTLTLGGVNTYSGSTSITAGTLRGGAAFALSASSDVSITGGLLDTGAFAQTVNSLTVESAGTLNLYIGHLLTATGYSTVGGTLNLSGIANGTVELMSFPNGYTGTFANPSGYTLDYLTNEIDVIGGASHWKLAQSGSWSTPSNWDGSVPGGIGAQAAIDPATGGNDYTITLDGARTVGTLEFGNSNSAISGYTLTGTDTLTLNNSGTATITVTNGKHGIAVPVVLENDLAVSGSGTLTFSSSISETGSHSLTLNGPGTLILSGTGLYTGGTIVNSGILAVTSSTALPDNQSLTVGAGGTLIFDPSYVASSIIATPVSMAVSPVPEPSTLALLAAGLVVGFRAWRRRKGTRS